MHKDNRLLPYLSLILLGVLYAYKLQEVGMTNWDAVSNYERVQAMAHGDFHDLFHHGSPTFFLLFTPIAFFTDNYLVFEYLNIFIMLLAIKWFVELFTFSYPFSKLTEALCILLIGSSLFMIDVARSFSIEALSLLIFNLIVTTYLDFVEKGHRRHWLATWIFLAILLSINYKIILFLPIFFLVKTPPRNYWRISLFVFFVIIVAYMVLGALLGVPIETYPKMLLSLFLRNHVQGGVFHFDFGYYWHYLHAYESPVLVATFLLFWFLVGIKFWKLEHYHTRFICWSVIYTVVLMSFFAKAPRGLLFILPTLYAVCFCVINIFENTINNLDPSKPAGRPIFTLIVSCLLIGYNLHLAEKNIFHYTPTHYNQLANYLKINRINKLLLTNGKGLIPFLDKETETKLISSESDLAVLKTQGYQYCLIDDYCKIAQLDNFPNLRKLKPQWQSLEPTLEAPLIYLDHSEFTGLNFEETLQWREEVMKDKVHLRLVKL